MAKVAVLVGPEFEDSELEVPVKRLLDAGHQVVLLGTEANQELTGKKGRVKLLTDAAVANHRVDEFDALVLPGGKSPAHLREVAAAVEFVADFCRMGRPVAAICHGPQLLIAAGQGKGRRMTAWPEVQEELRAFGAEAVDEPVVIDGAFITSRKPEDLDVFCGALLSRLGPTDATDAAPAGVV
ncbi:MAG TPA: type 1 glutamine amidotransferase domain-containing protein [Kofleriaceae bacterium]|nr:type 1 glutamine amidotransferase domain-containing protein [Kofleriaceae bacterium]